MSVPLSNLYQLTPRDAVSGLWSPFFEETILGNQAGAEHAHQPGVPPLEEIWWIRQVGWLGAPDPTSGSRAVEFRFWLLNETNVQIKRLFQFTSETIGYPINRAWAHSFKCDLAFVGGAHRFQGSMFFTAGDVDHVSRVMYSGYRTQRGNVTLR